MKTTDNYIIRLDYVPKHIVHATDGDIQEGEYLMSGAVECLLNGQMFSPLDCMWGYAHTFNEETAIKACNQLTKFNILASRIKILDI